MGRERRKKKKKRFLEVKSEEWREKMAFDPKKNARFGEWMEREHFDASRWIPPWMAGTMVRKNFSLLFFLDSREQTTPHVVGLVNVALLLTTQPHRRYNYNAPISTQPNLNSILIFTLHSLLHSELNYINMTNLRKPKIYVTIIYIKRKVHDHVGRYWKKEIHVYDYEMVNSVIGLVLWFILLLVLVGQKGA